MSDQLQYDASLGGTQDLPPRINLMHFASARAEEFKAMKQTLHTFNGTKLAFQRLPKHMRRRVMSHNAKRLPRRLREVHLAQLKKSGMPPKQKRPSRKYRRRSRNLLNDYSNRQRKHRWLETHIWHAKRFHMIEKWNHRLADRPCDKAFRACYRATTKHCLIQDLSYFHCVEINGTTENLIKGFKSICDCNVGLSIGAKAFIRGNREGEVMLFDNVTKKAIGSVYFHWKPVNEEQVITKRTLWMWIHAAYYLEVLNVLISCFDLKINDVVASYINENSDIQLTELKDSLSRFRLIGPLSWAVLKNTLKTVVDTKSVNASWLKNYLANPTNLDNFAKQCDYWKSLENLSSPAELPPRAVLSLIVTDPRCNLPKIKRKAVTEWYCSPNNVEAFPNLASGPIWDAQIRINVKENKISNAQFAELRSELLVPGSDIKGITEEVPVMVIHRPGNHHTHLGYSSGWDLIVPSGWGNTFWMSLIMWGGRAGGLREFNSVRFENGRPPFLAPDTNAGMREDQELSETYKQTFFNLPPNKRPNYTKFGIIDPFNFNWKILVGDWNLLPAVNDFFVLRDKKKLLKIQELLVNKVIPKEKVDLDCNMNCIVPVRIKLEQKGIAKRFARIFLAEPKDLIKNQLPIEPVKEDKNQEIRKVMRHTHKVLLKRLRRKRLRAKRRERVIPQDKAMLENYTEQMRKLWLPDLNESIRTSCSRQIIGFVTLGEFSFTQAQSCAVGYIAMGAIKALESKPHKNKVLVRNTASRQYRIATLEVIM